MDNELMRSSIFRVRYPPTNSCPRLPPQLVHSISILAPSSSGILLIEFGSCDQKAGQRQTISNLLFGKKNCALHLQQI
jgi:hypothetical protein